MRRSRLSFVLSSLLVVAAASAMAVGAGPARASGTVSATPAAQVIKASFWLAGSDGGVWPFGRASDFGSAAGSPLASPIVAMVPTPDKAGYWLAGADGGIFTFGDAGFFGSAGALHLAQPIVGMTSTPDGGGYWLVARDGGIFTFGDAGFFGSAGAQPLQQPIVSMTPSSDGAGYWLLAADGGVFSYGDAPYLGSMGATPSPEPAEKLVASKDGKGYWIDEQNGTAHVFGDATGAPPMQALMFEPVTPGDQVVLFAFSQLGKPYVWGGNGPDGYDCSGLALTSWSQTGTEFARVADAQYHTAGTPTDYSGLVAGDLVFWGSDSTDWTSVYHTAIYVGGGRIVESTGDHVQLSSLDQWGTGNLMPHGMRP